MQDESRFEDVSEILHVFQKFSGEKFADALIKRVFTLAIGQMMECCEEMHRQSGRNYIKGKVRVRGMEWGYHSQRRADGVQQFAIDGEWWPDDFSESQQD